MSFRLLESQFRARDYATTEGGLASTPAYIIFLALTGAIAVEPERGRRRKSIFVPANIWIAMFY
jgi:hypothetical protein